MTKIDLCAIAFLICFGPAVYVVTSIFDIVFEIKERRRIRKILDEED